MEHTEPDERGHFLLPAGIHELRFSDAEEVARDSGLAETEVNACPPQRGDAPDAHHVPHREVAEHQRGFDIPEDGEGVV